MTLYMSYAWWYLLYMQPYLVVTLQRCYNTLSLEMTPHLDLDTDRGRVANPSRIGSELRGGEEMAAYEEGPPRSGLPRLPDPLVGT